MASNIRAVKIHRGLYRLKGCCCGCSGELRVQSVLSHGQQFRWETFCETCRSCDCNGWPTLADCVQESPAYFDTIQPHQGEVLQ